MNRWQTVPSYSGYRCGVRTLKSRSRMSHFRGKPALMSRENIESRDMSYFTVHDSVGVKHLNAGGLKFRRLQEHRSSLEWKNNLTIFLGYESFIQDCSKHREMLVDVGRSYLRRNTRLEFPAPRFLCSWLTISVGVLGEIASTIESAKNISIRNWVTRDSIVPVHDRYHIGIRESCDSVPFSRPSRSRSKTNCLAKISRAESSKGKRTV